MPHDVPLMPGPVMRKAKTSRLMPVGKGKPVYYRLVVVASSPATEIWLGDDAGHFVQKEVGELRTDLLSGDYVVSFALGAPTYAVHLTKASSFTQEQLESGPTCPRPVPKFAPE